MIKVFCPKCDVWKEIDESFRSGIFRCSDCSSLLSVPEDAETVGGVAEADESDAYEIDAPVIDRSSTRFGPYAQGDNPDEFVGGGDAYAEDAYEDEGYDDRGGFDIDGGYAPEPADDGFCVADQPVADVPAYDEPAYDDGGFNVGGAAYAEDRHEAPPQHAAYPPPVAPPAEAPTGAIGARSFDGSSCTVLLVEPDAATAERVAEALAEFTFTEFTIVPVATLEEAQVTLEQYVIDLVLTELVLPDVRGMDTVKALMAATKTIPGKPPVVVHSKFSDQKGMLSVLKRGVQDFIVKGSMPLTTLPSVLLHAVQRQRMLVKLTQLAADQIARAQQQDI